MRLDLVVDEEAHPWRPTPEWEALARELARAVGPGDGVVELVLTGDGTVHELNREYRGKDRPTDVLSFSYLDGHEAHREGLRTGAVAARTFSPDLPEPEEVLVGQILVSLDFLERRGPREGRRLPEEILLLLIHGMLHVLGYDHEEDAAAHEMESLEREILGRWMPRAQALRGGEAA